MANEFAKSLLISEEFERRLKEAFPQVPRQWGFFDTEVSTFPSFYIFENDIERSTMDVVQRRGQYTREYYIGLSYFFKGPTERGLLYRRAKEELLGIYQAIETDDTFGGLCTHYHVDEVTKVFYKTNALQLAISYKFTYVEMAPWATRLRRS